jgi:NADH-quinone oxidoreductase subunit N
MIGILDNVHLALPEMTLLMTACIALLGDLFFRRCIPNIALYCAYVGLGIASIMSFLFLGQFNASIFHGLFISDDVGQIMKLFIYLSVFLSFFYSKQYLSERQMPSSDYYVLGLFSTLGMMILVSAYSLLTVYLGLELLSLPIYAMTAMRKTDGDASEAGLKYFIMGSIASGMLLYGISLLYGATGNLNLHDIANVMSLNGQEPHGLISFALVFIVIGVGFKLAAMPFHMWAPDVYDGAPSSVTLFISAAPKIAALGMAIRLLTVGLIDVAAEWQLLILLMALLSTGAGNLLAIAQTNIKRLFAYSAISHAGYTLFGILAATAAGFSASLYYIVVYSVMSVAAFGLIVLLSRDGIEITTIDDLKGLSKRSPWLAFMMLVVMLSMAGVPPTVGFFTKFLVLKALVDVHMTWVAVLGLVFAVIGAFYYLRIIKVMYFDNPLESTRLRLPKATMVVFSVNALSLLYLGVFPATLVDACTAAFVA